MEEVKNEQMDGALTMSSTIPDTLKLGKLTIINKNIRKGENTF